MLSGPRVVLFVDGENVKNGFCDHFGKATFGKQWEISHSKLFRKLAEDRRLVDIRFYDAGRGEHKREFFDRIKRVEVDGVGTKLVEGTVIWSPTEGKMKQKGVDVALACDMIVLALVDFYDVAVLVSNDSDYIRTTKYIKYVTGKEVEACLMKRKAPWGARDLVPMYHEWLKVGQEGVIRIRELNRSFLEQCIWNCGPK